MSISDRSNGYVKPFWDSITCAVVGRHLFDLTNGCAVTVRYERLRTHGRSSSIATPQTVPMPTAAPATVSVK
jgi:hypothetical protein